MSEHELITPVVGHRIALSETQDVFVGRVSGLDGVFVQLTFSTRTVRFHVHEGALDLMAKLARGEIAEAEPVVEKIVQRNTNVWQPVVPVETLT